MFHHLKTNVNSIDLPFVRENLLVNKALWSNRFPRGLPKAHSVPKKTKDIQKEIGDSTAPAASTLNPKSAVSKSKPAKRKSAVKRAPKTAAPPRENISSPARDNVKTRPEPTLDEIRLRAYFLSEKRIQLSFPADASADWLEAKRQLLEEAGSPSS